MRCCRATSDGGSRATCGAQDEDRDVVGQVTGLELQHRGLHSRDDVLGGGSRGRREHRPQPFLAELLEGAVASPVGAPR